MQVIKTISELSDPKKYGLVVYSAFAIFGFLFATYNDGKEELLKRRADRQKLAKNGDWIGIKNACVGNMFWNFFESVIFPYTVASNIMPKVVLLLNPE